MKLPSTLEALSTLLLILPAASCKKPKPPSVELTGLPSIMLKTSANLLYTYYDAQAASFKTATQLDDVPEQARPWVRVLQLSGNPAQRSDHELVYVADLTKVGDDGQIPYIVISRRGFEQGAQQGRRIADPGAKQQPAPDQRPGVGPVILYGTKWCGACKQARAYLRKKGIPFLDKDIEADADAAAELMRKARAAGIQASGVPVIDVRGTLMQGFNPAKLDKLLGTTAASATRTTIVASYRRTPTGNVDFGGVTGSTFPAVLIAQ